MSDQPGGPDHVSQQSAVPASIPSLKRKSEEHPTQGLSSTTKKIKALTLDPSSYAATLPSVAGMGTEIEIKATGSSITKPGESTYAGTPTTSKPSVVDGSLKVYGPSVGRPTPNAAILSTPTRLSTSSIDPFCVFPSQSSSRRSGGGPNTQELPHTQHASKSNSLTKVPISVMEQMLKHELRGKVCTHKKFFDEFLESNQEIQNLVLQQVRRQATTPARSLGGGNYVDYDSTSSQWTLHGAITAQKNEKDVYEPLTKALNVIGQAAFEVYQAAYPDDAIRSAYFPFINHHASWTRCDSPSDGTVMPDLLQGRADNQRVHWGDCELIIECKSSDSTAHRNQAFMQLARYARAVFAHQIYRVAVFGFSLCGSIVNFVYFDRSGMLHSPDLNLSKPDEADSFIRHMISLITLDDSKYGYDNRYSFNYEADPPQTLFKFRDHPPKPVDEILCQRKCCSGRATCVTTLGNLVHKTTWRPESQTDEGEIMLGFRYVFGFCQLEATTSIRNTRLKYANELEWSLATAHFVPDSWPLDSTEILRGVRVQNDLLMRRGTPLFDAQNPLHLALAIEDAVLGIMALTEVGKHHCDISAYNLLLINPKKHYLNQNWLGHSTFKIIPDVWKRTARGSSGVENESNDEGQENNEYESPRLERIKKLGRGPYCVLHDTEFTVDETANGKAPHIDRTGTPTFISAQLLITEVPINRTFMHDIESLFWVLLWVIAHRSQTSDGSWKIGKDAQELICDLSNRDMKRLGKYKLSLINDKKIKKLVKALKNPWCEDLAGLVQDLRRFLYYYLYHEETDESSDCISNPSTRRVEEDELDIHNKYLDQSYLNTFDGLFKILDRHIRRMRTKYEVDLAEL